jgi:predicted amidohydrolase
MGQMLVEGGEPKANLERARRVVRSAGARGCKIVVLPECLDLGWTSPSARELAQPIPGSHSDVICEAARESGIYAAAGLTERANDRIYNAAILVSPAGEILLKHRKINELDIALDLYATGKSVSVAETPLGIIGINICADNFPESLDIARCQARMGCRILLSPCAWAVDADHDNEREPYGGLWMESYTTLTKLHDMTVVGVSNVGWLRAGPWKGRKCVGCSLAVGPGGKVLARGPYGEAAESLIVVEL